MKSARLLLLLLLAYLAVFLQAVIDVPRTWLGSHVNLVPPLMVCAALRLHLGAVALLAILGGLWLDALSANPLGVSILPLYLIGWGLWHQRDLLLRELDYAQLLLGAAASAVAPVLTLGLVLTKGPQPAIGWYSLWQWTVLTVTGGVLTPVLFRVLDRLERALTHPAVGPVPYRTDHEMRRGRY